MQWTEWGRPLFLHPHRGQLGHWKNQTCRNLGPGMQPGPQEEAGCTASEH